MQISWTQIKQLSQLKKLPLQFIEDEFNYNILLADDGIVFLCILNITDPRNSDQEDFEDNFKSDANSRIKYKTNSNQELLTEDIVNGNGVQSSLTVTNTPIEVKVGANRLTKRKVVTVYNNSNQTMYWGYTNSVTSSTGTPIERSEFIQFKVGEDRAIYLVAASGSLNARITEASNVHI